jgi:hypothetical protein
MGRASYKVVPSEDGWSVVHDGTRSGAYSTKEAAFEAVVAAATGAIKSGHEITIAIPGSEADDEASVG